MKLKLLWNTHPILALIETWVVGALIIVGYSPLIGHVSPLALSNGVLLLCGTCGMWAVLRARLPQGGWLRQAIIELAIGLALSLVMAIGLYWLARLTGLQVEWDKSNWSAFGVTLLLLMTGPGYVATRVGVRLWLFWNSLRQRRMLWAITHAHLTLVVWAMAMGAVFLLIAAPYSPSVREAEQQASNWMIAAALRLLTFAFPLAGVWAVMTLVALAVVLPPSALFSFLVARRTTRRLEQLATAARSLRSGDYHARTVVSGADEVAQLQADFNAMADTLERTLRDLQSERDTVGRLLQSRRELIANVSHELRTPVATVRALLDSVLERGQDASPSLQHDLTVVQSEVTRLQGLIDDLFTLSRADAGGLALDCRATDVGSVVKRMVEAIKPLAWQSGRVEVVADIPQDLPAACVDAERLDQVLANLLRNGVRHTPPGGIVAAIACAEVACAEVASAEAASAETEQVVIEVRDTGHGIAPDDLPHIWERFYRGQNGVAHDGVARNGIARDGAGLGLAIVKEMIEAMGGSVSVESIVGQGSRFTVRLRRA